MNNIFFQIPDIKKYLELNAFSNVNIFDSSTNFINIQQTKLEDGFFCTQINCCPSENIIWQFQAEKRSNFLVFCFWIEVESEKEDSIISHFLNIVSSNNDFKFQLKKNGVYKGYIISLAKNWIRKSIDSTIIKNYLFRLTDTEVKSLSFEKKEIINLINQKRGQKWQLNVESWQLMGLIFEKIVFEIQNDKLLKKVNDKNNSAEVLKGYIKRNIHRVDLNIQHLSNITLISPNNIYQSFENAIGISLSKYIADERMNKALELLKDGQLSVRDVSERVGFGNRNLSYFSRCFKNKFGISPTECTKLLRSKLH